MKRITPTLKRCPYCGNHYVPYVRAAKTQKSCSRASCRKKRKLEAQKKWVKANPGYFRGRYVKVKGWLESHPGYLAAYRAAHPEYVGADNHVRARRRTKDKARNADIQDGLLRRRIAAVRSLKGADIQDTLNLKLDGVLDIMSRRGAPICKTDGQFHF
jgi:hypothetical protein